MKTVIAIFLCFVCLRICGQTPENKYNIKIANAKTVNVYGTGKVVIGKIVINQSIKSKLFLTGYSQNQDSTGQYKTIFKLANPNNEGVPFFAIKIAFKFNSSVTSVEPSYLGTTASAFSVSWGFNSDSTAFVFNAAQVNAEGLQFTIYSKQRILTEIYGIDGKL